MCSHLLIKNSTITYIAIATIRTLSTTTSTYKLPGTHWTHQHLHHTHLPKQTPHTHSDRKTSSLPSSSGRCPLEPNYSTDVHPHISPKWQLRAKAKKTERARPLKGVSEGRNASSAAPSMTTSHFHISTRERSRSRVFGSDVPARYIIPIRFTSFSVALEDQQVVVFFFFSFKISRLVVGLLSFLRLVCCLYIGQFIFRLWCTGSRSEEFDVLMKWYSLKLSTRIQA